MDLRWRLVVRLGVLLLALVLATLGVVAYSLRSDTEAEVRASERLVQALVLASRSAQSDEPAMAAAMRLQQLLEAEPLRHLSISLGQLPQRQDTANGWLARWLLPEESAGAQRIRIVPMFLGVGRHAREDLPPLVEQLRAQYPEVALTLTPAVGEHPLVLAVLAEVAAGLHG